jgi:hypothetical protein
MTTLLDATDGKTTSHLGCKSIEDGRQTRPSEQSPREADGREPRDHGEDD